jgi:hypothetical protein
VFIQPGLYRKSLQAKSPEGEEFDLPNLTAPAVVLQFASLRQKRDEIGRQVRWWRTGGFP